MEIKEGSVFHCVTLERLLENIPRLGSSVGVETGSGTLGGYFEIQKKDGSRKVVGITCHHVLSKYSMHLEVVVNWSQREMVCSLVKVLQPSTVDFQHTEQQSLDIRDYITNRLQMADQNVADLQDKLK